MQTLKRGETRNDGMVFYHYTNTGKEYWITKDKFEKYKIKEKYRNRKRKRKKKSRSGQHITSGTIREDGMVFLRYYHTCKNCEYWVTQEAFEKYKQKQNLRKKNDTYRNKNKLRNREYKKTINKSIQNTIKYTIKKTQVD